MRGMGRRMTGMVTSAMEFAMGGTEVAVVTAFVSASATSLSDVDETDSAVVATVVCPIASAPAECAAADVSFVSMYLRNFLW